MHRMNATAETASFRLRTPRRVLELGQCRSAQQALEHAVRLQDDAHPTGGVLEVQIGHSWHRVDIDADMP